ncbi:MAG: AtpZ/AtpI family protein [Planctomycetota bacterium]|jgi:F0F1-type ATP synthase assembly protein I
MSASRPPADGPSKGRGAPLGDMARLGTLGFEFSAGIAVFGMLGWWLDGLAGWRDSFPFLLLVGVFLGLGLGIYRLQLRLGEDADRDEVEDDDAPPEETPS